MLIANVSTVGTSPPIDTSGANFIAAVAGSASPTAPTDNYGNTWLQGTVCGAPGSYGGIARIWYAENAIVGPGHIFYASGSLPGLCIAAFDSIAVALALDVDAGCGGGVAPAPTQNATASAPNALYISGVCNQQGVATVNNGFTITDQIGLVGGYSYGCALAYYIQPTPASLNLTWDSYGLAAPNVLAVFNAGGSPPPPSSNYVNLERSIRGLNRGLVSNMN